MPGRRMLVGFAGAASLLALMLGTAPAGTATAGNAGATSSGPRDLRASHAEPFEVPGTPLNATLAHAGAQAPTDAQCRAATGSPCYSPQEIRHAYGVDLLMARGDDGKGETIVIFDSYGSPTIASDLASFDAGYGLPAPPSFTILSPLGTVPFDPTAIPDQVSWAAETTLDVEWSHAMAPDASIVLMTSPVDETEGVQGMPQFNALENYALDHHLGQVISQSWGATENTLFTPAGEQVFRQLRDDLRPRGGQARDRAGLHRRRRQREYRGERHHVLPVPDRELPGVLAAGHRGRRNQPVRRHQRRLPV